MLKLLKGLLQLQPTLVITFGAKIGEERLQESALVAGVEERRRVPTLAGGVGAISKLVQSSLNEIDRVGRLLFHLPYEAPLRPPPTALRFRP